MNPATLIKFSSGLDCFYGAGIKWGSYEALMGGGDFDRSGKALGEREVSKKFTNSVLCLVHTGQVSDVKPVPPDSPPPSPIHSWSSHEKAYLFCGSIV